METTYSDQGNEMDEQLYTEDQIRAIAKADRIFRRELEAITDPKLREECLRAF